MSTATSLQGLLERRAPAAIADHREAGAAPQAPRETGQHVVQCLPFAEIAGIQDLRDPTAGQRLRAVGAAAMNSSSTPLVNQDSEARG